MQFSKRVSELARNNGITPQDVLFAMLITSGASAAEAFAVIYHPATSTTSGLSAKASNYIGQRPGLKRAIKQLDAERVATSGPDSPEPVKRRGRPRKADKEGAVTPTPEIDYTNKEAMLREAWEQYQGATTEAVKAKWYGIIVDLQRMDKEQTAAEEKRVHFFVPLGYERAEELRQYLTRYYAERDGKPSGAADASGLLE